MSGYEFGEQAKVICLADSEAQGSDPLGELRFHGPAVVVFLVDFRNPEGDSRVPDCAPRHSRVANYRNEWIRRAPLFCQR
jgi:hypothetical protein